MDFKFSGLKIEGIMSIEAEVGNDVESIRTRNISDVCVMGLRELIKKGLLAPDEIGIILSESMTPDAFFPNISSDIQRQLELDEEVVCMDIAKGASGFVDGIIQAGMLLKSFDTDKGVLLCTGDFYNRIYPNSMLDNNPHTEVATITFIKRSKGDSGCYGRVISESKEAMAISMLTPDWIRPLNGDPAKTNVNPEKAYDVYKLHESEDVIAAFVKKHLLTISQYLMERVSEDRESDYGVWGDDGCEFVFIQNHEEKYVKDVIKGTVLEKAELMPNGLKLHSSYIPAAIARTGFSKFCKDSLHRSLLISFGAGLSMEGIIMCLGRMSFCEELKVSFSDEK